MPSPVSNLTAFMAGRCTGAAVAVPSFTPAPRKLSCARQLVISNIWKSKAWQFHPDPAFRLRTLRRQCFLGKRKRDPYSLADPRTDPFKMVGASHFVRGKTREWPTHHSNRRQRCRVVLGCSLYRTFGIVS